MKIFSKNVLLLAAVVIASTLARANDSAIQGSGGTPTVIGSTGKVQVLKGEHPAIRMVRETVAMTIGARDYNVVANFVFHNDGAARTVVMGFPEGAGGDVNTEELKKRTSFKSFATWVDGRRIAARRVAADADIDNFEAYWIKSVRFARHQTRRVRVSYRAPLGETTDGDYVFYEFTGGNWKGTVDDSLLSIKFTVPGTYQLFPFENELGKFTRVNTRDGMNLRWRNWQAQTGFVLRYLRSLPGGLEQAAQIEELNNSWEPHDGLQTLTVRTVKKFDPWQAAANWPPSAVLRDGRAYIQFRRLSDAMREAWEIKNRGKKISYGVGLHVNGDLAIAPYYGKARQVIAVEAGKKTAEIGGRKIALPVAPFRAGGVLYVPLAAMANALGGTARVNSKTHRYWLNIPV
jgi:hypothetical protein